MKIEVFAGTSPDASSGGWRPYVGVAVGGAEVKAKVRGPRTFPSEADAIRDARSMAKMLEGRYLGEILHRGLKELTETLEKQHHLSQRARQAAEKS